MVLMIALIAVGVVVLAVLELWLFWSAGERDDRRRRLRHGTRSRMAAHARPTVLRQRVAMPVRRPTSLRSPRLGPQGRG